MADESRKIILDLQINAAKSISEIVAIKDQVAKLKAEQKALNLETVEGQKANEAYTAQIKALTKEQKSLELAVEKTAAGFQFEAGSIAANRAELSKLTAEYKNLAKPTAEQTKRIKELSDRLKEQEAAIGNTSRNVGNYKEAITQSLGSMNLFGSQLGGMVGQFSALKGGLTQGATGFKALGGALAATGILAFVLILQKLIEYFKSTEAGAEMIEKAMAGLGAVVDTLIANMDKLGQIALNIGKLLFQVFTLQLGDAADTVGEIGNQTNELGKQLEAAAREAVILKGRLQDLEDTELKQSVLNAKRKNEVAELIKQSKIRTSSEEDRLAMLDKAAMIEKEGAKEEIANAKERLSIAQKQLEIDIRNGKIDKGNLSEDAAKAEIAYQDALSQSEQKLSAIEARRSAFLLEANAERQKAIEKELELRKQLEDATIANIADARTRELKEIQVSFERKVATLNLNSKTERALKEQLEIANRTSIAAINKKFDDQEIAAKEKHDAELKAALERLNNQRQTIVINNINYEIGKIKEGDAEKIQLLRELYDEQLKLQKSQFANQRALLDEAALKENANLEAISLQRIALKEQEDAELIALERKTQDEIFAINEAARLKDEQAQIKANELRKQQTQQTVQETVQLVNQFATVAQEANKLALERNLSDTEEARKKELANSSKDAATQARINKKYDDLAERQKKDAAKKDLDLKLVQAVANVALGVSQALAQSGVAGIVTGVLVAAAGAIQIAAITKQKSQLAKGGLLDGPSHAQGGITGTGRFNNIEVEGGEFVVNKRSTKRFLPLLRQINYSPNRAPISSGRMAQGGQIFDGGISARNTGGQSEIDMRSLILEAISNQPAPVVLVKDINGGQQRNIEVRDRANVTR